MRRGAKFNEARTHRQRLWRGWGSGHTLTVIGMNPSTADETDNDPTAERCERRARALGYGGLIMINMMDIVETDSSKLDQIPAEERCTEANTAELLNAINSARAIETDILCGWGRPGQKHGAVAWLATQASRAGVTLFCLRKNQDGSPAHPLYIPYSKEFEWFAGVDLHKAAKPIHTNLREPSK